MKKFIIVIFCTAPIVCMDDTSGIRRSASARILAELADLEKQGEGAGEELDKIAKRAAALQKMVRKVGADTAGLGDRSHRMQQAIDDMKGAITIITETQATSAEIDMIRGEMNRLDQEIRAVREYQVAQFSAVHDGIRDIKEGVSSISDDKYQAKLAAVVSICVGIGSHIIPALMRMYQGEE